MNTGRMRLLSLREQAEAVGEDMEIERGRFDRLADREPTRAISAFNLFQTPPEIAARMVAALGTIAPGCRILEPSAGLGRLYHAIRSATVADVVMVEQSPDCCGELYRQTGSDPGARLVQGDFLECDAARLGGLFDFVVMNPPFKQGKDVRHIRHAAGMLKPGGRLVSLCYAGTRQRTAFADWKWQELPAGAFKSEGTRADVAMIEYSARTVVETGCWGQS